MILSAHQPVFMPHCGTFSKITQADLFCIFDGVQFERHGYSNRVKIKTHQGAEWLTVPVEHGMPLLKDAQIAQGNWGRKMCRTIELAYQKAPYFDQYFEQLTFIIEASPKKLADLNKIMLQYLLFQLGIKTKIVTASDYHFIGEKSALVLDMCKQLGATRYVFGALGESYADKQSFADAGIELEFQKYQCKPYPQLHGGAFIPGLSIIDLLMNVGPDSSNYL